MVLDVARNGTTQMLGSLAKSGHAITADVYRSSLSATAWLPTVVGWQQTPRERVDVEEQKGA